MSGVDTSAAESAPPNAEPLLSHQLSSIPGETPVKGDEPDRGPVQTVKTCLVGTLNWAYLYKPLSLYATNRIGSAALRFRRDFEFVPLLLNVLLGLQHALVALGHIVIAPLSLIAISAGVFGNYLLQSAVLIAGIGSVIQSLQIKIPGTPYQIGCGMASFLGNSHTMVAVFIAEIFKLLASGDSLHDAFGKVLGTAAVCSLFFIGLSLIPRKYMKVAFPPVVSAVIIVLIGVDVLMDGIQAWGGGKECARGLAMCHSGNVILGYGAPEWIGLGFMVLVVFFAIELFGTGFLRHNSILIASLVAYAISALLTKNGDRYVTGDEIDGADDITFLWVETFQLGFEKKSIMPLIAAYLVTYFEATGILTASVEEAGIEITSQEADERIQGGLITTGLISLFAVLATGLPVVPISQTNAVSYISRVGSRFSGVAGGIWLIIMGIFGKLMAFLFTEVPVSIRGGMFSFICATVILTGLRVLSRLQWDRRTSMIVITSLALGLSNVFTPRLIVEETLWEAKADASDFEESIRIAILVVLESALFLGGVVAMMLHLALPKDMELGEIDALPSINE